MSDAIPAGSFVRPVSPELARVLAQAANSAFAPPTFYVVARYEPADARQTLRPFNVQQPVATYAEAQQQVAALAVSDPGVAYGIFGPFAGSQAAAQRKDQARVAKLHVTTRGGGRDGGGFTIPGEEFDALFYSEQAVEKFLVPYYVQEYGPEFGLQVLNQFRDAPLALVGHLPWSEEGAPVDGAAVGAEAPARRNVPVLLRPTEDGGMERAPLTPPVVRPA